jgi:REP element-mobilizing transposase RayT
MLRGINKQGILIDDEDREWFLRCVVTVKRLSGCRVLAYCLMTNHIHLVIRTGEENVGQVMKRIGVRYASWHNRKYGRVGHLFQDRFKSRPVDDDTYLITLLRYVWNNPVEAGIVRYAHQYKWSSVRLLGRPDEVIDEAELLTLVPSDTLAQLASGPPPDGWVPMWSPRTRTPVTRVDAAGAVREICDALHVDAVDELTPTMRDRAVSDLLERGLSIRQIATLTGLGRATVGRIASEEAEWRRASPPESSARSA